MIYNSIKIIGLLMVIGIAFMPVCVQAQQAKYHEKLLCNMNSGRSMIFDIDLASKTVSYPNDENKSFDATITDSTIKWKYINKHDEIVSYTLNRYSGDISTHEDNDKGNCHLVTESDKKF